MKTIPIAVAAIALSAVLAACGSSGSKSNNDQHSASSSMPSMSMSASTTTKGAGTAITIKNFAFAVPASVAPGATLTVTNDDSVVHTITLKSAKIDKTVNGGANVTITAPKSPGSYAITCNFHPNMHGSLVVK
jgi:plastocyanin